MKEVNAVRSIDPIGGRYNCTNCVSSVDNQLKTGAPSSALPMQEGLPFDQLEPTYNTKLSGWTTRVDMEAALLEQGNGTRAVIYGMDEAGASAHVWNAVVQRGQINYIDGQLGRGGAVNFKYFPYLQYGILP